MGEQIEAKSCSADVYRLGGVRMGLGSTGKQGLAWHGCMGAVWVVHGTWCMGFGVGINGVVYMLITVSCII